MRFPAAFPALLAAALAAVATGCGGGDPKPDEAVRSTVERFGQATAEKDYRTICEQLLSTELVRNVERVGLPCEQALRQGLGEVRNPRLRVGDVAVQGDRALVSVRSTADDQPSSDDAVELVREAGEWRIASLANPEGGGGAASTTTSPTTSVPTPDHDDRDAGRSPGQGEDEGR